MSCISDDVSRATQPSKPQPQPCCASAANISSARAALTSKDSLLGLGLRRGWSVWEPLPE